MQKNNILVAIPTYNEKDNIPLLYKGIKQLGLPIDILFIDDNSPDGTGTVIDELIEKDATVHVIHRPAKMGLGTAHKRAFSFAKKHGYDYLITMDADLTHDPKYIPDLLARKDKADIVIGSRYTSGGSMHGWHKVRLPLTYFWRSMIKNFLGLPYDCTGAYRLYNVRILKPETYNQVKGTGFAFCMESLYRFAQHGAKIVETPIEAHSRIHGDSKLSWPIMFEVAGRFFSLSYDRFLHAVGIRKLSL